MSRFLPLAASLLLGSLTACHDDAPQGCYSGTVIGTTCMDGVLIEVASNTTIGRSVNLHPTTTTSITGANVVAAVNDLGSLATKGQTVYFTYQSSPNNAGPLRYCTQENGLLPIPHLVLTNIAATSCAN